MRVGWVVLAVAVGCGEAPAPDGVATCEAGAVGAARTVTADDPDVASVSAGVASLGWALYGAAVSTAPGDAVVSPWSASVALAAAWSGAAGSTADELGAALGVPDGGDAAWSGALARLREDLEGPSAGGAWRLRHASRLYGVEHEAWDPAFQATVEDITGATLGVLDPDDDPDALRADVDGWFAERTCGAVPSLFEAGQLGPLSRLVMADALFVEAAWATPLSGAARETFRGAGGGGAVVTFGVAAQPVLLATAPGATIARLGLAEDDLALWVALPDQADGLAAVEAALDAPRWEAIVATALASAPVTREVHLPLIAVQTRTALTEALPALGVSSMFSNVAADFSKANPDLRLFVGAAPHAATLAFTAAGVGAAEGEAPSRDAASSGEEILRFDRPFLFVLRDERAGVPLLFGRVTGG